MDAAGLDESQKVFHNRCPLSQTYHIAEMTDLGHALRQE